jgi:hypothetical protein
MWKVRKKVVPIINGALRTIKMGLEQILQLLPGHPSAIELQKITLMNTAHSIYSAGVNHLDLLLRSELTRRPPPGNN